MIKKVQIKTGYLTQLPATKDQRIFEFNDKFNVLYGENGSGKSSLIKVISAYSGIEKAGWTSVSDPGNLASKVQGHFPFVYRQYSPGQCDAYVEWDGTPTFYNDSEMLGKNDMTWFFQNERASGDGLTSEVEQMEIMATKPSSGQYRIHKINKIMKVIQRIPNTLLIPNHVVDKNLAQLEVNYFKSLPRNGKVTLLLDEPEKALALPKQFELFSVLEKLSEHFQVIIATHSPFILFFKGANIIDMQDGYSSSCRKLIADQINKYVWKKDINK